MACTKIQSKNVSSNNSNNKGKTVIVLDTALLYNDCYQCMKFKVDSFSSLEDVAQTKTQS